MTLSWHFSIHFQAWKHQFPFISSFVFHWRKEVIHISYRFGRMFSFGWSKPTLLVQISRYRFKSVYKQPLHSIKKVVYILLVQIKDNISWTELPHSDSPESRGNSAQLGLPFKNQSIFLCCRILQTQTASQSLRTCRDPQHFLGHTSRWLQWMTHSRPAVRGVWHMTVCLTVCVLLSESLLFSRSACAYRKPQCHNLRSLISCTH